MSNCTSAVYFGNSSLDVNSTCDNCDSSADNSNAFILLGSLGIVVIVIPTILLGAIILPPLIKDKKGNQSINAVLLAITVICLFYTIPIFLFDLSLITDTPAFGRCVPQELALLASIHGFCLLALLLFSVLLSIVFYAHIRSQGRSWCSLNVVRVVIVLMVIVSAGVVITLAEVAARFTVCVRPIRGSYCASVPKYPDLAKTCILFFSVVCFILPLVLNIILIILTCYRVLSTVVELDRKVVRAIVAFLIAMIMATFITRIPPFIFQFFGSALNPDYDVATIIALKVTQLSAPVLLCVILILHKKVRKLFLRSVRKVFCSRCSRKVESTGQSRSVVSNLDLNSTSDKSIVSESIHSAA